MTYYPDLLAKFIAWLRWVAGPIAQDDSSCSSACHPQMRPDNDSFVPPLLLQ